MLAVPAVQRTLTKATAGSRLAEHGKALGMSWAYGVVEAQSCIWAQVPHHHPPKNGRRWSLVLPHPQRNVPEQPSAQVPTRLRFTQSERPDSLCPTNRVLSTIASCSSSASCPSLHLPIVSIASSLPMPCCWPFRDHSLLLSLVASSVRHSCVQREYFSFSEQ
jgi:hypothetical protein